MSTRLLVVEDNRALAEGLRVNLALDGYAVRVEGTGPRGLAALRQWDPHLVILDLMLPGLDGMSLHRIARDEGYDVPVLILSARGGETDRVRGFRHGADDYVVKPFSLPELLGRVAAMLRRRAPAETGGGAAAGPWRFGAIEVDHPAREVRRHGKVVALRPKEYDLLVALVRREGRVASRAALLDEVWQYEADVLSRTVDVHMLELRRKLEDDPARPVHLLTVRKTGYRLVPRGSGRDSLP